MDQLPWAVDQALQRSLKETSKSGVFTSPVWGLSNRSVLFLPKAVTVPKLLARQFYEPSLLHIILSVS